MTVTNARLAALEQMRPVAKLELHLRPDDAIVAFVKSNTESERIAEINTGYRSLAEHQQRLRADLKAMREGLAKVQFNHVTHTRENNLRL